MSDTSIMITTHERHPAEYFAEVTCPDLVSSRVYVATFEEWDTDERYPDVHHCIVDAVTYRESSHGTATYRVGICPELTCRDRDGNEYVTDSWTDHYEGLRVVAVSKVKRKTHKEWDSYRHDIAVRVETWRVVTLVDDRGRSFDRTTTADDKHGTAILAACQATWNGPLS